MKNCILVLSLFSVSVSILFGQQTMQSPKVTAEGNNVKVTYGQPSKKGREIFGDLVPFGKVWRTGANEATEITFLKDAKFAGKDVKAGTYTLFTIPEKEKWTIILNSKTGEWGAFNYDKIKDKDVLKAEVNVMPLKESLEKLSLTFDAKSLIIAWDKTSVVIPVIIK